MTGQVNPFANKPQGDSNKAPNAVNNQMDAALWDDIMDPSKSTGIKAKDIGDPEKNNKRMRNMIIIITCLLLIALAFAGYLVLRHAVGIRTKMLQNSTSTSESGPKIEAVKPEKTKKTNGINNPVADNDAIGEAAKGDVTASIDKRDVSVKADGNENRLQIPALTEDIKATSAACTLKTPGANCYLGESKVKDKTVMLWSFRDAKTSALLASTSDVKTTPPNGSAAAFISQISYNGKNLSGLFIVDTDQTGVLIASEDQGTINEIAAGSSRFQMTSGVSEQH